MGVLSPVTTSSLNVQLDWFRTYLQSICDTTLDGQEKLSRSLVLIEKGGNDYNYAMLQGKPMDQVRDMVPQVVDTIKSAAKQVIGFGATRVYIPGNFPIGCLPIYKATFGNYCTLDKMDCLDGLNDFARFHNAYIKKAINDLQKDSILKNVEPLGFDVSNKFKACCGSSDNEYNFDLTRTCGSQGYEVCADPNKYISWDGIHMTQQAYKRMSQWLLQRLIRQLKNV
ncbi:hypothetical protein RND81_06G101300 [Saponaria officinalis]|uniref:Uncharacterized protein n=1 Tax=Saponaria officinalis TaxID=3572 RepID=A0AAW1KBX6_SAPOF